MSQSILKNTMLCKIILIINILMLFIIIGGVVLSDVNVIEFLLWSVKCFFLMDMALLAASFLFPKIYLYIIDFSSTGMELRLFKKTITSVKWDEIKYLKIHPDILNSILFIYTDESKYAKISLSINNRRLAIIRLFCTNESIKQQIDNFKRPLYKNHFVIENKIDIKNLSKKQKIFLLLLLLAPIPLVIVVPFIDYLSAKIFVGVYFLAFIIYAEFVFRTILKGNKKQ